MANIICPQCARSLFTTSSSIPAGVRVQCPRCQHSFEPDEASTSMQSGGPRWTASAPSAGTMPASEAMPSIHLPWWKSRRVLAVLALLLASATIAGLYARGVFNPVDGENPAEQANNRLEAFLPAKANYFIKFGPQSLRAFQNGKLQAGGREFEISQALVDILRDFENTVLGIDILNDRSPFVLVAKSKDAINFDQVKRACSIDQSKRVNGKMLHRGQMAGRTAWLHFPGDRLMVISTQEEQNFVRVLEGATQEPAIPPAVQELMTTADAKNAEWLVTVFDDNVKASIRGKMLMYLPFMPELLPVEPVVLRAKGAILTYESREKENKVEFRMSLLCADERDSSALHENLERYWKEKAQNMLNFAPLLNGLGGMPGGLGGRLKGLQLPAMPGFGNLGGILAELNSIRFQRDNLLASASLHVSQNALLAFKNAPQGF